MNQICVVFGHAEQARDACRSLERTLIGRAARHLSVYHRGGMVSSRLARARARAGAAFGAVLTSVVAVAIVFTAVRMGFIDGTPGPAIAVAAALGAAYGMALGAIIAKTVPTQRLQRVEHAVEQGRSALLVEFDDPVDAAAAHNMLHNCAGAVVKESAAPRARTPGRKFAAGSRLTHFPPRSPSLPF